MQKLWWRKLFQSKNMLRISQTCYATGDRMFKLKSKFKLKAKAWFCTDHFCPFRSLQCVVRLRLSIQLVGEPLKICLKSLSNAFSSDANRGCGQGLLLKRSFTSCSEAQVKPRGCPSLIWTSIRPINGQITRTTLKSSSVRSLWCGEHSWKKLLPKPVGIIVKTSLPSSKRFTGIFCSSFRSKLKSELIKSSRNAPWTKSTDGLRDGKCPEVVLVSVTCQFKPIGSLLSSAGYSKINSSRAGSLYLAPFFSPALCRGSPSKQVSLLAG